MKMKLFCFLLGSLGMAAEVTEKDVSPVFSAVVNGHSIQVRMTYAVLDPKTRKIEKREVKTESGVHDQWFLQDKAVLGTDNTDPAKGGNNDPPKLPDVIESITITWDGKVQIIPPALFDHIVNPHRGTNLNKSLAGLMFLVDPDGDTILIDMGIGDGGAATGITWRFSKDGSSTILPFTLTERGG